MPVIRSTNPAALLALLPLLACGGGGGTPPPVVPTTGRIGGTATGVVGDFVMLQVGDPALGFPSVLGNSLQTSFHFDIDLPAGNSYPVTVALPPACPYQRCTVSPSTVVIVGGQTVMVSVTCTTEPPPPGAFIRGCPIPEPGSFTASAPLATGELLVVGGQVSDALGDQVGTPAAARFDPATGVWTSAAPMSTGRLGPCAARLPSGKVLVAGGGTTVRSAGPPTLVSFDTAELYDPLTDTWTPAAGTMAEGRTVPQCVGLPTGEVLVMGGFASGPGAASATAERFDEATGEFSPAGAMSVPRYYFTATPLADGRVLAVGGCFEWPCTSGSTSFTDLYDPAGGGWSRGADLTSLMAHAATGLADGTVLVAGGCRTDETCGDGEADRRSFRYDPSLDSWSDAGPMAHGHAFAGVAPLASGGAVILGGPVGADGEVFSASTGTWTPVPAGALRQVYWLNEAQGVGAFPLPDGGALFYGAGRTVIYVE